MTLQSLSIQRLLNHGSHLQHQQQQQRQQQQQQSPGWRRNLVECLDTKICISYIEIYDALWVKFYDQGGGTMFKNNITNQ
jgi:hypothetical protein